MRLILPFWSLALCLVFAPRMQAQTVGSAQAQASRPSTGMAPQLQQFMGQLKACLTSQPGQAPTQSIKLQGPEAAILAKAYAQAYAGRPEGDSARVHSMMVQRSADAINAVLDAASPQTEQVRLLTTDAQKFGGMDFYKVFVEVQKPQAVPAKYEVGAVLINNKVWLLHFGI